MATQSEINAALGLPPGINPDGSWNAQDYIARKVSGQPDTQAHHFISTIRPYTRDI